MNAQVKQQPTEAIPQPTPIALATATVSGKAYTAPELLHKSCDQAEKSVGMLKESLKLFSADYRAGIKAWPYGALPKRVTADKQAADNGNLQAGIRYRAAGLLAKYNSIWKQLAANNIQLEEGDTIVSAHKRAESAGLLVNGADGKPRMGTAAGNALEAQINGKDKGAAAPTATASADVLEVMQKVQGRIIAAIEAVNGLKGANSQANRVALDAQLREALREIQPFV